MALILPTCPPPIRQREEAAGAFKDPDMTLLELARYNEDAFARFVEHGLPERTTMTEAKPTWGNPIWHRGYRIYYDPPPVPTRAWDWHFVHEDYDGEGDPRCGAEASVEACKAAIDEIEAEDECPVCWGTGREFYEPADPTKRGDWRPCHNCDGSGEVK